LRKIFIGAAIFFCLVMVAALISRLSPPLTVQYLFVITSHGECWVQRRINGPRESMACRSIAGYLKDTVGLPVGATIGVGVSDKDSATIQFIAELNRVGYKVVTVGPARRVVFPN